MGQGKSGNGSCARSGRGHEPFRIADAEIFGHGFRAESEARHFAAVRFAEHSRIRALEEADVTIKINPFSVVRKGDSVFKQFE